MQIEKIENFPHPYYKYGSENSLDTDVIIRLTKNEMPDSIEERRQLIDKLLKDYDLNWNATIAVFENGVMVDTLYPKAWVDSLNNAFLATYHLHHNYFDIPVNKLLTRNKTLAIYKTFRSVFTFLSRTVYRPEVKKGLKWKCPIDEKANLLRDIDFSTLEEFNKPNDSDCDIWKVFAFYIAQNFDLITNDIEIYSKNKCIERFPELSVFINRGAITFSDKVMLNSFKNNWVDAVLSYGDFSIKDHFLFCKDEVVDMKKEIFK